MKSKAFLFVMLLLACSCSGFYALQPKEARTTGNIFMDSVFSKKDFASALSVSGAPLREDDVKRMSAEVSSKFGRVEAYKAEYYVSESDSRAVIIMYSAVTLKAIIYVKVTVTADEKGIYRVTGASYTDIAPEIYRTARQF